MLTCRKVEKMVDADNEWGSMSLAQNSILSELDGVLPHRCVPYYQNAISNSTTTVVPCGGNRTVLAHCVADSPLMWKALPDSSPHTWERIHGHEFKCVIKPYCSQYCSTHDIQAAMPNFPTANIAFADPIFARRATALKLFYSPLHIPMTVFFGPRPINCSTIRPEGCRHSKEQRIKMEA